MQNTKSTFAIEIESENLCVNQIQTQRHNLYYNAIYLYNDFLHKN